MGLPSHHERRDGWRFLEIATGALLAASVAARSADAGGTPTFDTSVEMVQVDVAVSDGTGHHVSGLESGDLTLYEDGVPQQLRFFSWEPLPLSLVLLVDASASMRTQFELVQRAAGGFVEALRPEDRAQLRRFTQTASVAQDFTSDPEALKRGLQGLEPSGVTSLYSALYITLSDLARHAPDDRRRRVIVLLTDGVDTSSLVSEDQVLRLARQSDVAIYSIGVSAAPGSLIEPRPRYFLTALSRDSGGQAYFPAAVHELDAVYAAIADDLRTRYCVGYIPSSSGRRGVLRHISVLIPNKLGLRVRHRTGYYPSASGSQ